jgi:hypothetical protein
MDDVENLEASAVLDARPPARPSLTDVAERSPGPRGGYEVSTGLASPRSAAQRAAAVREYRPSLVRRFDTVCAPCAARARQTRRTRSR